MDRNRREFPRVERRLAVEIVMPNGHAVGVTAYDISRGGLRLECPRDLAARAFPNGFEVTADNPEEVTVTMVLPFLTRSPQRLEARCALAHLSPAGGDGYRIGLRFTQLMGNSPEALESYILECMRYA